MAKTCIIAAVLVFAFLTYGEAFRPIFTDPIVNLTVPVGRDATFQCLVQHLGGYRVGWVKVDTKAIQAIHHNVITHNPRISISHSNHATWNLHIRGVQEEDGGVYMCQINTDPMKSQIGILKVVVSPDFIHDETSGDVIINEGTSAYLKCKASGRPAPRIEWRREDGTELIVRNATSRTRARTYVGHILNMTKISRSEMGVYLCIASNGIPPAISKRINVSVTFPPVIQVPNQLLAAPERTAVTLECNVQAYPRPINYWLGTAGEMLLSNDKRRIYETMAMPYEVQMRLIINSFNEEDKGTYQCVAKNSLGAVHSNIRLYDSPTTTPPNLEYEDDGRVKKYGLAENEQKGQLSNSASEHGRRPLLQITLRTPRATYHTFSENHIPQERVPSCTAIMIAITTITFPLLVLNLFLI
uniref:Ig-like domain-containing protein n=1 Tax=Photinus pyralis TaxID=7054 RepID=A0A1Y1KVW7_PHOPY